MGRKVGRGGGHKASSLALVVSVGYHARRAARELAVAHSQRPTPPQQKTLALQLSLHQLQRNLGLHVVAKALGAKRSMRHRTQQAWRLLTISKTAGLVFRLLHEDGQCVTVASRSDLNCVTNPQSASDMRCTAAPMAETSSTTGAGAPDSS
jgi:hypothetical protein